jgi:hypothetical protein
VTVAYPYTADPQLVASILTATALGFSHAETPYRAARSTPRPARFATAVGPAPTDRTLPFDPLTASRDFVHVLHPHGYRNLRALDLRGRESFSENYAADDLAGAKAFLDRYRDRELYVGVAMRTTKQGGGGGKNCFALASLFADIDFKDHPTPEVARLRLDAFPYAPSIEVHSGGGIHA